MLTKQLEAKRHGFYSVCVNASGCRHAANCRSDPGAVAAACGLSYRAYLGEASGGVRDTDTAVPTIEADAIRIGTSSGAAIVNRASSIPGGSTAEGQAKNIQY
ncbi:Deoxyribose-phosphate aldolase [Paenibacillus sp. CECT 9249]|nr:Deoxyribose-phosphate aldolase [Paenibacillus sp. CECT 9249]